jgi:hypothetical protein
MSVAATGPTQERAEEELLDDHGRDHDRDAHGERPGHDPEDGRIHAAGRHLPDALPVEEVPDEDEGDERQNREQPARDADEETGREVLAGVSAPQLEEVREGLALRE